MSQLSKIQIMRVESIASTTGCARWDGIGIGEKAKLVGAVAGKRKYSSRQRGQEKRQELMSLMGAYSTIMW